MMYVLGGDEDGASKTLIGVALVPNTDGVQFLIAVRWTRKQKFLVYIDMNVFPCRILTIVDLKITSTS